MDTNTLGTIQSNFLSMLTRNIFFYILFVLNHKMLQKQHKVLEEEPKYLKKLLVNHSWLQKERICYFRFISFVFLQIAHIKSLHVSNLCLIPLFRLLHSGCQRPWKYKVFLCVSFIWYWFHTYHTIESEKESTPDSHFYKPPKMAAADVAHWCGFIAMIGCRSVQLRPKA